MLNMLKGFIKEEDGMGTVEIVVIVAVLVGIALIFRKAIVGFVNNMLSSIVTNPDNMPNPSKIQQEGPTAVTNK